VFLAAFIVAVAAPSKAEKAILNIEIEGETCKCEIV